MSLNARSEFEKCCVAQNRFYESDLDRMVKKLGPDSESDSNE